MTTPQQPAPTELASLQHRIGQWHRATFGEDCGVKRIGMKALEEASELHMACRYDHNQVVEEAADVAIALCAIADRLGFDLATEIAFRFRVISKRPNPKERDRERGIED